MAEIACSHSDLLRDIDAAPVSDGVAYFWWMGQHTFIVKTAAALLYIDPWFADWPSRQTPRLLRPDEAEGANVALITHGHGDHLCPETLRAMVTASPGALFVCPRTEEHRLLEEAAVPDERIRSMSDGDVVKAAGARITAIRSKHETFDEHPALGFPFLGYVVESGGVTFYHSGDTIRYDGQLDRLRAWSRLDAAFLPINGRDAERFNRDCLGNFTFQEAVELAGDLAVGLAVPSHYDMFIGNQENPARFVEFLKAKYPLVPCWVGPAGTRVRFTA